MRIVAVGDRAEFARLRQDLAGRIEVEVYPTAEAAAGAECCPGCAVALVLADAGLPDVCASLDLVLAKCPDAKGFVLTEQLEHRDLAPAVDKGQLDALVVVPTAPSRLLWLVTSAVHDWMLEHGLEPIAVEREDASHPRGVDLLSSLSADEEQLMQHLLAGLDEALDPRPRIFLPAGVCLTREGQRVDGVFILISGKVALTRSTPSEDLLLHHASTGRLIGMLALARQREAYFTSTTTTPVEAIFVSFEQLERAMLDNPEVALAVAVSTIHGLSQRLLRSEDLQVERNELNWQLEREQAELARTLRALEEARLELISQARFATLGEMSAGIAHELNNPVAALQAAAQHMQEDLATVLRTHPDAARLTAALRGAQERPALSTRAERAARRQLAALLGEQELAWRLVAAGVTDPRLVEGRDAAGVELLEAVAALGTAARNIRTASGRISHLVRSLRSYARPEGEILDDVDVNTSIDETLQLVSHRLYNLDVERDFGTLVPVRAHPSQLGQVWTNLLVNAADALGGSGRIVVTTRMDGTQRVVVSVADNGPGIPPEHLERVFEPRFTTKHGTVRFGMGLGLGLTRSLVEAHGGQITVESHPGSTRFTVVLPVAGP